MVDSCEYKLAHAFRPMLSMSQNDDCRYGEPYWAAKYIDNVQPHNWGDFVRIVYLPGYYSDCGTYGHSGDSEFIQLTVAWVPAGQHWKLINSFISAHVTVDALGNYLAGPAGSYSATWGPSFQWPSGHPRTWPRIFVSRDKHGNYRTISDCNNGGALFGIGEDCAQSADAGRLRVWKSRNIGNPRYPLIDCVSSAYYGPERQECLWTGDAFGGWQDGGDQSTSFRPFLVSALYSCYMFDPAGLNSWCSSWGP